MKTIEMSDNIYKELYKLIPSIIPGGTIDEVLRSLIADHNQSVAKFDPTNKDCGSNSCYFKSHKSYYQQRTNSGCRCFDGVPVGAQISILRKFKKE